jgi:hypothetical protein
MPDDDDRDYGRGPGHHHHTRGPVIEAYVDTDALEIRCPNCGVHPGEFCRHDTELGGGDRKVPCPKRITAAAHLHDEASR